ncbi:methionine gamma-lyase family protein [Peptoniphilus sp. KCTC 25270]|uniref:methionine gamma-lyase family protein n=1 Tax=Peptoniphilus sp. KCTC 25270 TaxID=2897414 RepID=UPI001E358FDA|nr:methionine gamma-lyase family protein [Peptoniphilus sp. KCTC 25270]MCD1147010.1 methionine gamma-lyase family protein [Peptoniphilus sp. KCTC 25270]
MESRRRIEKAEEELRGCFSDLDSILHFNQKKVLDAMQSNRLASTDFHWTTGYGYGDVGREKVESIYSRIFLTEDALVRPNIVSGTHAISLVLHALTESGDEILSLSGSPYDTLQKVIGITGEDPSSLIQKGREYREIPLKDGKMDLESFNKFFEKRNPQLIIMQRSTGYGNRRAFTVQEIQEAVEEVRKFSQATIFLDNCYGEFTEIKEPTEIGVDIMAGSLIKNPGGGLAYTGGYIVGRESMIDKVASQLTAPGIGKECGLTFGQTRNILMGLFLAPERVIQCIKGSILFAKIFEEMGYKCIPRSTDPRSDIVQSIELKTGENLVEFCRSIQSSSPVDSHVTPYPWDMPGYVDQVIMAAGGFIEGSSIELSADGPMKEPYTVYFQGGLTYSHIRIALENVLNIFIKKSK